MTRNFFSNHQYTLKSIQNYFKMLSFILKRIKILSIIKTPSLRYFPDRLAAHTEKLNFITPIIFDSLLHMQFLFRIILNFNDKINLDSVARCVRSLRFFYFGYYRMNLSMQNRRRKSQVLYARSRMFNEQQMRWGSRDTCNINAINEMVWFLAPKTQHVSVVKRSKIENDNNRRRDGFQNVVCDFHYRCRFF